MIDHHSLFLLAAALGSVIGLILLIAVFKLNPFISLLLASLGLGRGRKDAAPHHHPFL